MRYQKSISLVGVIAVALSLELGILSLGTPQLRAQPLKVSVTFPPTEDRGAPIRTEGGGQRGSTRGEPCLKGNNRRLVALIPQNNVATTVSANPSLFWYVPETTAKSAEFILVDNQNNKVIYHTALALNATPGVVKVSLPTDVSLKAGKNYLWVLSVSCNSATPIYDVLIQGWLERTELSPEQKTKLALAKDSLRQAEVYAEAKVWQETLAILAQLHKERPNDPKVTSAWNELLKSVGLDRLATQPLLECCTDTTSPE